MRSTPGSRGLHLMFCCRRIGRKQEAILRQITPVAAADYIYNERKWPIGNVSFHVNLNSDKIDMGNGTADDFLAAILNGAMTWSMAPDAEFVLTYTGETETVAPAYDHTNNVFFIDKGLVDDNGVRRPLATATVWSSNGVILDADITVNDAYQWDATGQPERTEIDLESVVLHEFGHWLSLGHDSNNRAVMYYAITTGTLKRALFDNDQRGIGFIYPCAAGQVCNPDYDGDATPHCITDPCTATHPHCIAYSHSNADSDCNTSHHPTHYADASDARCYARRRRHRGVRAGAWRLRCVARAAQRRYNGYGCHA
jgi:hypothetical protein